MRVEAAFYRLSEELLTLIVQQQPFWSSATLKVLRLAHPRFAYLSEIQRRLFSELVLSASPTCLNRLQDNSLDEIAKYATNIEFAHSIFAIDVPRQRFFYEAREYATKISAPRRGKALPDWRTGIPEHEIETAYTVYAKLHEEYDDAITSGRAMEALVVAMNSTKKPLSIKIGQRFADYGLIHDGNTLEGAVLQLLNDKPAQPSKLGSAGERWMRLVVGVLAESKVKPVELEFCCWSTGTEPWEIFPGWDDFSLREIETLILDVELSGNNRHGDDDADLESRKACAMENCSALIKKAGHSVQYLKLGAQGFTWGKNFEDLSTPRLRVLDLSWTSCDAGALSRWLRRCESLEIFTMYRTPIEGPSEGWRMLFKAIRDMPNDIIFELGDGDLWISCDTSKKGEYTFDATNSAIEESDDLEQALGAYLSGSSEWSPSLEEAIGIGNEV